MAPDSVPLAGSNRELPPNAKVISSSSDDLVQVTVVVRRRSPLTPVASPSLRLSREEFAQQYGADPADLERVEAFARAGGLTVMSRDLGTRSVILSGSATQMEQAFGVKLMTVETGGQMLRVRSGMIYVPAELQATVEAVLGLDNRPPAAQRA